MGSKWACLPKVYVVGNRGCGKTTFILNMLNQMNQPDSPSPCNSFLATTPADGTEFCIQEMQLLSDLPQPLPRNSYIVAFSNKHMQTPSRLCPTRLCEAVKALSAPYAYVVYNVETGTITTHGQ